VKKLLLRNFQAPGDIVMLTAAVRDLQRCHPGEFAVDVRTSSMELWENNPHLTPLSETDPEVRQVQCDYPLIHQSNQRGVHFLWGFIDELNRQLGTDIHPTEFRGDIHLSSQERQRASRVSAIVESDLPYWVVVAGGKFDFTIKWWHFRRYQKVIDHFRGKMLFVQVGEKGHHHPRLSGVLSLFGQTTLRELIHLVYHAQGVLCPVTSLMHLAAAVPLPANGSATRPCVVVAGGREPPHWEAYPHHQFIHTVGLLPCCAKGGCWRARTVALGDGDTKDRPDQLCMDVVDHLPRCMALIEPAEVARRIELYFQSGASRYLTRHEFAQAEPHLELSHREILLRGMHRGSALGVER
jgi:ADP-heptose:LPS heptosyltransferase